ncbi:MAG: RNA-binding domain-containing protein [Candidatus Bathyarchaeia archaeon]|jgi:RNA binding exosome subunit
MSQKPPIGYVDLRVFAHATEDPEKVLTALRNLLPTDLAETAQFEKSSLTGHHGNPITLFTTQLTDKKLLPVLLDKLGQNLNILDKEALNDEIKLHLEKHNLYLRFDKQSAFLGKIKFAQNDPIHLKIHFKNKTPEEIVEICKKSGLLP